MTSIQSIKSKLEKENQKRNKLIGQQEMLIKSFEEFGYSAEEAKKAITKLSEELTKMKKLQKEKKELFIKKFGKLLK